MTRVGDTRGPGTGVCTFMRSLNLFNRVGKGETGSQGRVKVSPESRWGDKEPVGVTTGLGSTLRNTRFRLLWNGHPRPHHGRGCRGVVD